MIMSGVRDGTPITLTEDAGHGVWEDGAWVIRVGREADNDLCLNDDDFSSRHHARLHCRPGRWLLEDCNSKNKTYIDNGTEDQPIGRGAIVALRPRQLFRVGRTWLRIERFEITA